MSTTSIKLKKSSVSGKVPLTGDIDYGELALNYADGKLFYKHSGNTIRSFLDSSQVLYLIDSDYLKSIINASYLQATRPIVLSEDLNPELGNHLNLNGYNIYDGGNISITGSIATTGNITAGVDLTGTYLKSTNSVGDEGGEILLAKPQTNTTLAGTGVTIDIYQNRIRFFEQGGTSRGAFIDITAAAAGANTNLLTGGSGSSFDSAAVNSVLDSATANGTGLSYSNGTISIANTGVIAGTYGSASLVPVVTVNAQGQVDSIGTVSVAGVSSTDWDSSTGNFIINTADGGSYYTKVTLNPYTTTNLAEGTNLYYTTTRANTDFDTRLGTKSTTNLTEGTNLYYTTARANTDFDTRLGTKSTTNLTEGTNLYYTTTRANTDFDTRLGTKSTTNLVEGDNLYYTLARVNTAFDNRLSTKSTTNLVEGTNLYYTSGRADSDARNAITGSTGITYNVLTGTLSSNDGQIVHDNLSGFVANEHIDHSTVSIVAGNGLTGGGTIVSTRTLSIDSSQIKGLISGGTGIIYSSTTGIISLDQTDSATFGSITTIGDIVVGGNLQVTGTTTTVGTQNLEVSDNMIYMNAGESSGSPTMSVDVGWAANVNDNGSYAHVGLFRDATDDRFKVFKNYTPEPDAALEIDTSHASFALADFQAGTFYGALSGTASNADLLDNINSTSFVRNDTASETITGLLILNRNDNEQLRLKTVSAVGDPTLSFYASTTQKAYIATNGNLLNIVNISSPSYISLSGTALTYNDNVTTHNIWHAGNDGAASGLDADLLDGQHGSYYRINVYNSAGTLLN